MVFKSGIGILGIDKRRLEYRNVTELSVKENMVIMEP